MASTTFTTRDRNRYKKIYPFVRVQPSIVLFPDASLSAFVIEANKVTFTNANSGSYTFGETYTSIPTVVATSVDSAGNNSANVNVFIQSISLTSVTFGTSDFFTGQVHFHVLQIS